jgi:argininosuccinate synthase
MQSRDALIPKYSELVYNGFWFSPEREALQALITETQHDVIGVVRLKLYKGNIIVAGRKSPKSLYDRKIATMEGEASQFDQSDATGFIRLNALQLKLSAALRSATHRHGDQRTVSLYGPLLRPWPGALPMTCGSAAEATSTK